jgi:riboflavin synthase alpha subunit
MAVLTGGVQADRSNTDWPDELGALWPKLDQQLLTYPLSAPPVESGLQVTVNGVVLPATSTAGTNWTFDATSNSLRFDPLARPQSGDAIEITYTIACGN